MHIHHFSYIKKFDDSSEIYLSNKYQWIADYYEFNLYKSSNYVYSTQKYPTGFNVWSNENNSLVFQHGRDYFDNYHGLTLCCENKIYQEFFFFGLSQTHDKMWRYLINNLDLLERFSLYFREKTNNLLKSCDSSRIKLPSLEEIRQVTKNGYPETQYNQKRKAFLKEIQDRVSFDAANPPYPIELPEQLTPREKECLFLLMTEQTSKNIARHMNISVRTAETHLENIRQKWQCNNKIELILKALAFYKTT